MNTQKMPLKNSLCLLLAATIWGIAFVAQSVGMEYVGPFTFNGVRSLIGAAVLVPVIFLLNRSKDTASTAADSPAAEFPATGAKNADTSSPYKTRDLWIGGIACGIALFAAVRHQIYNGRKSRLHHSLLYCHCPDYRILSEKEMQSLYLGSRCHGTDRTLSSLHHGRFFHWSRRRPGAGVCVPVFSAHSGH